MRYNRITSTVEDIGKIASPRGNSYCTDVNGNSAELAGKQVIIDSAPYDTLIDAPNRKFRRVVKECVWVKWDGNRYRVHNDFIEILTK